MEWQHSRIEAAASYLREMIEAGASDDRTRTVYEGLLDVLEPARVTTRLHRAAAADAFAAIMPTGPDRRGRIERRGHSDRRLVNLGPNASGERRACQDRRLGDDRRNH
jgi:hypothetical protein